MKRMGTILVPLAAGALIACGDASGPAGGGTVTLRFTMAPAGAALQEAAPGLNLGRAALASLPLAGTNGTLTLDEVWLVVKQVTLEAAATDSCAGDDAGDDEDGDLARGLALHGGPGDDDDDHGMGDDCDTTLGPFFVEVPLEGEGGAEVSVDVVPGVYEEIELKTGAPRDSGSADLLAEIRTAFPDWPAEASLLVVGSFTPIDGDPVPFRVYFDARIKVEREFEDEPLVVEEGGDLTVTVTIDPARWITNPDGSVDDLSVYDYDTTGEVVDFGMRSGDGCRIEREDD